MAPKRAHAAIGLVGGALVKLDLARRLLGAGKQAADHDGVRAGDNGLGDVTGEADAAVRDDRNISVAQRFSNIRDRGDLRYTNTRHDARRADGARADADLHSVRASVDERARRFGRRDVAGDDLLVAPLRS